MKYPKILLLLPALATLSLTSCVVPGAYPDAGVSTVGVSYGSYATLPPGYAGDAYFYGGRYYSGGRYENGSYHDHGRAYTNRYYHDGRYYYGGRHESHDGHGHGQGGGNYHDPRVRSDGRTTSWQSNRSAQPYNMRRVR